MKKFYEIFITLIILSLLITSCSKKKTTKPGIDTSSTVTMSLSSAGGGSIVGTNIVLTNKNVGMHTFSQTAYSSPVIFNDVPFGIYTISASLYGHLTYTNNNFSVQSTKVSHNIVLSQVATTVAISLSPNNYQSTEGANVRLRNNANNEHDFSITTETYGVAQFSDVPYGTYTVTVTHPNFESYSHPNLSVQTAYVTHTANLIALPNIIVTFRNETSHTDILYRPYHYYKASNAETWILLPIVDIETLVTLVRNENSRYDFRTVWYDYVGGTDPFLYLTITGERYSRFNITLNHGDTVIINETHRETNTPIISIKNSTGVELNNYVSIRPKGTDDLWSTHFFGSSLPNGATASPFIAAWSLYDKYDVQISIAGPGFIFFQKTNVSIVGNTVVEFTMSDAM
ncbi:MAG: carboxypeptidase-like regulatory domain-containing protein [Candidatus Cloacimonetes bacterium]|nr:carboxypeptidase-like regulatory domain-containing protein [Candidatus Cloacimonadota bacterium]